MASFSFDPDIVHLQMEQIKQYIQDATSDYLVNITTPNTNLLDTADDTIKYIKAFFQACHSYPGPPTTPTSQFSSPDAQEHITPDLRAEAHTTTYSTDTASVPNVISPTTLSTL